MKTDEIQIILESILEQQKGIKQQIENLPQLEPQIAEKKDGEKKDKTVDKNMELVLDNIDRQVSDLLLLESEKKELSSDAMDKLSEKLSKNIQVMQQPPKEPLPQTIKHKHSFTDWKWLVILFLFIGFTGLFSWLYYDTKTERDEYQIKYGFVQKENPKYVQSIDSFYLANPEWMDDYIKQQNSEIHSHKINSNKKKSKSKDLYK